MKILTPAGWKPLHEETSEEVVLTVEDFAELMDVEYDDLMALSEEEYDELTDEFLDNLDENFETINEDGSKKMYNLKPGLSIVVDKSLPRSHKNYIMKVKSPVDGMRMRNPGRRVKTLNTKPSINEDFS